MIDWFVALSYFLAGVLVTRHLMLRSRSVAKETVVIGIDRKKRKVTVSFERLGGEYALGADDARVVGACMMKQAEKFR